MTPQELEDEAARPAPPAFAGLSPSQRAHGRRLAAIHDMYRAELAAVSELLTELRAGRGRPADLAARVSDTALARNLALFGTACGRDCALLQNHHDIEEQWMFPAVAARAGSPLAPVLERLVAEHKVIHRLIGELHDAAEALVSDPGPQAFDLCAERFDRLNRAIRSHFGYEETALEGALGAYRVPI
ncbi:MAG: hypothetical protein FJX25_06875 [Alphaproteobacteria bacterium]|nr:hypothetical protein [Alphaproteobacteria bacterium]